MNGPLLSVEAVSKSFALTGSVAQRLGALLSILRIGQPQTTQPVLSELSFEVHKGQSLAIIGGNGAGKSTLLKLITGVMKPSTGTVSVAGSTAALLELGAGFDPEQTGLANLHMNAAFLGLSPSEVSEHLDDILAFADIGEAIDEPVKHYSSGMVVRLGFAVVAAVKPDLLITDEVLAVGDESFQKKCIRWIEGYLAQGGTLLMVSHNMYQVQKLCKEAIWLDDGCVRHQGEVFEVTQAYLAWHEQKDAKAMAREQSMAVSAPYGLVSLSLNTVHDQEVVLEMNDTLSVSVEASSPDGRAPVVLIGLVRIDGTAIYGVATDHDQFEMSVSDDHKVHVTCLFDHLPLLPGAYQVRVHTLDPEGLRVHDTLEQPFRVTGKTRELGSVRLSHHWSQS